MALLSREAILNSADLKTETVQVPEWGGEVIISTMTGAARDAWEQSLIKGKETVLDNVRARLVAACVVDEKGARLFSEKDAELLGKKSASALERCVKVAQRLNRLTETELQDMTKN